MTRPIITDPRAGLIKQFSKLACVSFKKSGSQIEYFESETHRGVELRFADGTLGRVCVGKVNYRSCTDDDNSPTDKEPYDNTDVFIAITRQDGQGDLRTYSPRGSIKRFAGTWGTEDFANQFMTASTPSTSCSYDDCMKQRASIRAFVKEVEIETRPKLG